MWQADISRWDYEDTWIAFNGEIYNYRELQQKYLPDQKLKTHSDTEVLLHLYRRLGTDFVSLLDGMFAFVIYQNGEYLMARDPLGIKPLYHGMGADGVTLYFASEIKTLKGLTTSIQEFPCGTLASLRKGTTLLLQHSRNHPAL